MCCARDEYLSFTLWRKRAQKKKTSQPSLSSSFPLHSSFMFHTFNHILLSLERLLCAYLFPPSLHLCRPAIVVRPSWWKDNKASFSLFFLLSSLPEPLLTSFTDLNKNSISNSLNNNAFRLFISHTGSRTTQDRTGIHSCHRLCTKD